MVIFPACDRGVIFFGDKQKRRALLPARPLTELRQDSLIAYELKIGNLLVNNIECFELINGFKC